MIIIRITGHWSEKSFVRLMMMTAYNNDHLPLLFTFSFYLLFWQLFLLFRRLVIVVVVVVSYCFLVQCIYLHVVA